MIPRFPVIVGPTAGGKTGVAVRVCELLAQRDLAFGEVITMDSMQVFRGMDIGTATPTAEDRRGVPHHMIDLLEPSEAFSVERWLRGAEAAITHIRERGGMPVVAGGTHLYAKALLEGLFEGPGRDAAVRAELQATPTHTLRAELERVDAASARRIHPNDRRRTVRALEVWRSTGAAISAQQEQWDRGNNRHDALLIGLAWNPQDLNPRINARVRAMIERGLIEEARGLWQRKALGEQAREALGYKQLIEHFEGRRSLEDAIERIKIETRRFAKHQRTWLRRLRATPGSLWLDAAAMSEADIATRIVEALGPASA